MAFPGTYNFSYYKGDTFEFKIYPKTSSGAIFDLTSYDQTSGAKFTVAEQRGSDGYASRIVCDAVISDDFTNIVCTISPENGSLLNPNIRYEYDVEISKVENSKTYTYTLVTGSFSVQDQVTGATPPAEAGA